MKGVTIARVAIVVVVLVCLSCVIWVFRGPAANNEMVGNANVVGGIAGLLALLVTTVVLWPRAAHRRASVAPATSMQVQTAADYLAEETSRYWQAQAKDRRITTPSPVTVCWSWASNEVAVPARKLQSRTQVLTAGVVTQLREQLYDRLDADQTRIVLLGDAGAGKTAAMLLLLIDILKQRSDGSRDPVPVWLTLGGWNPETTTLLDWAAATLNRDYPGLAAPEHGGPGTAVQLIRTGRVALFLDGLDEMPPAVHGAALNAIDRDTTRLRVVLTSRPKQYDAALTEGRLYGAAVIDLLPAEVEQAEEFLLAEQLGDCHHAWRQVIDHIRTHPDSPAARTLTTPLALSLARDTYTTANPTDLLSTDQHPTPETLLQHLLTRSLTLAYPDPAQRAHAIHWLSWIARHMGTNRDLRWWDIPTWIPRRHHRIASGLILGLTSGLTSGLALGLIPGLIFGLISGLIFGLISGLILGLILGLIFKPVAELVNKLTRGLAGKLRVRSKALADEPHRVTVRWPTRQEWRNELSFLLVLSLVFGLAFGLMVGLTIWLTFGLAFVLANGLVRIWSTPLAAERTASPLEVYLADRRRTLMIVMMLGPTYGMTIGPILRLTLGLTIEQGTLAGLACGLTYGLAIWLAGDFSPSRRLAITEKSWILQLKRVRFMPLLQTALHKQVLRQAGAVYQFRHAALQDLLATRDASTQQLSLIQRQRTPHACIPTSLAPAYRSFHAAKISLAATTIQPTHRYRRTWRAASNAASTVLSFPCAD